MPGAHVWRPAFNDRRKVDEKAWQFALRSENQRNTCQMLVSAQSLSLFATTISQYDAHPLLACADEMTLNLEQVVARAPSRDDYLTLQLGAEYDDCPLWRRFLREVFADDEALIGYIQRAWGYSLTGDTREQKLFLCYGDGSNGKSVFLSILASLLGEYAATRSFATFDGDEKNRIGDDLAGLKGCRALTVIETAEDKRLNEARVKSLTGQDLVTCRHLFGQYFSYKPEFKLWIAFNNKPTIRGNDRGIWRRIQLIPFSVSFEGREDKELEKKLKAELPGILNWALEGLRRWHAEGLNSPAAVTWVTLAAI
jgi:putative DNA primase/helicase